MSKYSAVEVRKRVFMSRKPFLLSAKAIIRNSEGKCLALKRSGASKTNAWKWDLPGGKMDACETLNEGLLREIREETQLEVTLTRVAGCAESETPSYRVAYIIIEAVAESDGVNISDEHEEYQWVDVRSLPEFEFVPQLSDCLSEYAQRESLGKSKWS